MDVETAGTGDLRREIAVTSHLHVDRLALVLAIGVDDEAVKRQDIRQYRLSSLEEPQEYMLEEIMHQVCESAMASSFNAHEVLRKKLEEIKGLK